MGLDQYAYRVDRHPDNDDFSFVRSFTGEVEALETYTYIEICRWRKHPNLHGFMEALWQHKLILTPNHGIEETENWNAFNLQPLRLTLDDLADLEKCLKNKLLPSTTGFFFGDNSDDYYLKQDLEFIKEARKLIAEGYDIYYDSWW